MSECITIGETIPDDAKLVDTLKPLPWAETWCAGSAAQITTANPQQFPAQLSLLESEAL